MLEGMKNGTRKTQHVHCNGGYQISRLSSFPAFQPLSGYRLGEGFLKNLND